MPTPAPWLDDDLLPLRPERSPAGWWGADGLHEYDAAALPAAVRDDQRGAIHYVWLPALPRLLPLAEAALGDAPLATAVGERDARLLRRTLTSQVLAAVLFAGLALAPALIGGQFGMGLWLLAIAVQSADSAVAAGLALRQLRRDTVVYLHRAAVEARYWLWAARAAQRPWRTWCLVAAWAALHLMQLAIGLKASYAAVALDKEAVRAGDWVRLATAGLVHVEPLHLVFNALAFLSLGRAAELLATARAVLPVFAVAVVAGNLASLSLVPQGSSLGASGGVCGMLGFLLMLAWRRRALLPPAIVAALWRSTALLAVFGALAWNSIDNAAHGGGLVAGAAMAVLLVPVEGALPLQTTSAWRVLDLAAVIAVTATALTTAWRLLGG